MKKKLFFFFSMFLILLFVLPQESFPRGGGRGGSRSGGSKGGSYKSSSSKSYTRGSYKSSRGTYKGGIAGTRQGSHYSNPKTRNHYQKKQTGSYSISSSGQKNPSKPRSTVKLSPPLKVDKSVKRDSKGKIIRSEASKEAFLKSRGLKSVPRGYEVDHIIPLYAGGKDHPSNMHLLTKEQHRIKTKEDYKKYGR